MLFPSICPQPDANLPSSTDSRLHYQALTMFTEKMFGDWDPGWLAWDKWKMGQTRTGEDAVADGTLKPELTTADGSVGYQHLFSAKPLGGLIGRHW
jgi:hypothetical protein